MNRILTTAALYLIASMFPFGSCLAKLAATSLPPELNPDITVAQDGSGDFESLQAAIDSVPEGNTERTIIFIKNGTYNEHIRVENSFLTLLGEDRAKTRIVWEINDPRKQPDANARGPLDVEVMDATGCEFEIGSSGVEFRLHGLGCLPWNLMLVGVRPVVQAPKSFWASRPACSYGRVLVTPGREPFAPDDFNLTGR